MTLMFWCILCFVTFVLIVFRTCKKPKNYPPGPMWLPFVGNAYQLKKLSSIKGGKYLAFEELRKVYNSDVIGLKLNSEYVVVVFGNKLVNEVNYGDEFQSRPNTFFMKLRTFGKRLGITTTDGDIWKVHRTFVVRHLKLLGIGKNRVDELICEEYLNMAECLYTSEKSVTPGKYLQSAFMNVLWELTASTKFEDTNLLMLMKERCIAFDIAGGLLNQIPWIRYIAPNKSGYSLINKINQQIYSIISNCISEHKESLTDQTRDIIDAYLHQMNKEKSSTTTFTEEQLIAVCLDLFIAGSQITSSTLDFAILAMARWPEIQTKVQLVLDNIRPPGSLLTAKEVLKNPYVEAVLLETKRLHHVIAINGPRRVLRDSYINGYSIPKNTTILMSLYSIHHDRSKFEDPEVFRPERFIDKDGKLINTLLDLDLQFFGAGKRRCPGESLAQRFVALVFANLVHDYTIKIDELNDGVNHGILITPKPYKIKLIKRE